MHPIPLMLLGAGPGPSGSVALTDKSIAEASSSPSNASCYAEYQSDGQLFYLNNGTASKENNEWWTLEPAGVGGSYDVRASLTSGSAPDTGPALNTWHNLASARKWYWEQTSVGTKTAELFVEIRDVSTSTIQDSHTVTVSLEVV